MIKVERKTILCVTYRSGEKPEVMYRDRSNEEMKAVAVEQMLVEITKAIAARHPDTLSRGLLGGEFGYGCRYENAVFKMRPYCYCIRESCPCGGEGGTFLHRPSGFNVSWYKYIGRRMEVVGREKIDLECVLAECLESVNTASTATIP